MKKFKIFLSGSVQKQFEDLNKDKTYWGNKDEKYLIDNLDFPIELLNPNTITIDKRDAERRFNKDLTMLLESDLVLVDAKDKKGIGIGSEMILAKLNKIPVYSVCPYNSHYRKQISEDEEWIHPFIYELSDKVFTSSNEMVSYLNNLYVMGKLEKTFQLDAVDILDKLKSFDGGYDEGYTIIEKFWGDIPANFVKKVSDFLVGKKDVSCLDLGCGHGKNAVFLSEKGFKVVAMDSSYYAIREAKKLSDKIEWKVRDIRKFRKEKEKYNLVIMTGSLHCLSSYEEIYDVVENAKLSTKIGGYNVLSAFNNDEQDLSGHSRNFHPLLLKHNDYLDMYKNWKVIESSNTILQDIHNHNNIPHKHSITRLLVQRIN